MGTWGQPPVSSFEPNIFKPKGKTPRLMTEEFIVEAERLLSEIGEIERRHKKEILLYQEENPQNTDGLSFETWRNLVVVEMITNLGKPDRFDYNFHEISRKHRLRAKVGEDFQFEEFFLEIGPYCSITPLYKTIWSAQSYLDVVYRAPPDSDDPPLFEVAMYSFLQRDVALLSLYKEIYRKVGQEQFLNLIGVQDFDLNVN
jgi:hypothetical protein